MHYYSSLETTNFKIKKKYSYSYVLGAYSLHDSSARHAPIIVGVS